MKERHREAAAGLAPLLQPALLLALALLIQLLPPLHRAERSADEERVRLRPARFADLPGWRADDPRPALDALTRSCRLRLALADDLPVEPQAIGGRVADWRPVCEALAIARFRDADAGRDFIESHLRPVAISVNGSAKGLFTGYYEPLLEASLEPRPEYPFPVYRRPPDLVSVDLGVFREDARGRAIAGRVVGGHLLPYASRAEIMDGALEGRGLELMWVRDPVALFFLHIQGSGRARLPDGRELRIGYDGANGHRYRALGRLMAERGLIAREAISAPAIARWLREHPEAAMALMAENPAYVFFRRLEGEGPLGSEGSVLTPGRSLAVDRAHLPLGFPLWLATSHPDPAAPGPDAAQLPLRRLMVAQDSGSAIEGVLRGDVFWGAGEEAEAIAGRMANEGRLWLLLPAPLAARLSGDRE